MTAPARSQRPDAAGAGAGTARAAAAGGYAVRLLLPQRRARPFRAVLKRLALAAALLLATVLAVVRGPDLLRFDDPAIGAIQADDRLIVVRSTA